MNLKELYQEIILEHGKNPRNLRKTDNFTRDAKGNNPLCGDNVHIYLKLNDNNKVEAIVIAQPFPSNEMSSTLLLSLSFK